MSLLKSLFCAIISFPFIRADIGLGAGGYSYPIPPGPQFDEPVQTSPPSPIYLPPPLQDIPQVIPTYLPPQSGYPPLNDEILPPFDDSIVISSPPSNQYLPPSNHHHHQRQSGPIQLINMSCLDPKDGTGFFRTFLRSAFANRVFPVIESATSNCHITPLTSDTFRIDLDGPKMLECGVRSCNGRLCLILRMATVPGLRLADDPLITLQCQPQEPVVSLTKHLKLNANTEQGRSSSRSIAVASGGGQRRFETEMFLLRRGASSDSFDQQVNQGSAVRLGDDLMLRTVVKDGDGWKYSRMGSVLIRSAATQKSVALVDDQGCRIATMKSVCPQHPQQVSALQIELPFKAFLFQGAAPADDLLLSVRMIACLRARDCLQSKICADGNSRVRRSAKTMQNNTIHANLSSNAAMISETEFQFRVLPSILADNAEIPAAQSEQHLNVFIFFILAVIVSMTLICSLLMVLVKTLKKCIMTSRNL